MLFCTSVLTPHLWPIFLVTLQVVSSASPDKYGSPNSGSFVRKGGSGSPVRSRGEPDTTLLRSTVTGSLSLSELRSESSNYQQLGLALGLPRTRELWELSTADLAFLKGATLLLPTSAEHEDILFRLQTAVPQLKAGAKLRVWALASRANVQVEIMLLVMI